jgi:poly(3-hydroxyalkanoate) synthetase
MELLQYGTATDEVKREPMLVVPSLVNKYYLTDLSPGRSLVEHLIGSGYQTFHVSWVNPGPEHRRFDLATYVAAIAEALEAVSAITGAERSHVLGVCAGGQLLSIALAHLAALGGQERVASLALTVCVMDHSEPASPTGLLNRKTAERAMAEVDRRGIVDGRRLQTSLAWLRPVDSIWWAWVERYLLAADIPKLDLFHWSEDTTNLPAGLVRDLMELTLENQLTKPGSFSALGTPIDLGKVKSDAYIIAGLTDNLTPWKSCYRTTSMLGSRSRFTLVRGGHLQAILRPPGGRQAGYTTVAGTPRDPDAWLAKAKPREGSWWEHWVAWLDRRCTGTRPAPAALGNDEYTPIEPAPGSYVRQRLD